MLESLSFPIPLAPKGSQRGFSPPHGHYHCSVWISHIPNLTQLSPLRYLLNWRFSASKAHKCPSKSSCLFRPVILYPSIRDKQSQSQSQSVWIAQLRREAEKWGSSCCPSSPLLCLAKTSLLGQHRFVTVHFADWRSFHSKAILQMLFEDYPILYFCHSELSVSFFFK